MKYDIYIVFEGAAAYVWPISNDGAEAIRRYIPGFNLGDNVEVNMKPEEFQALFPAPLRFLGQNPATGEVGPFNRIKTH